MGYTFALAGNPNCGKTSMFNEITGSTQYVGNWPGVTVEKKEGKAKKFKEDVKIIDLPGIYSLSPYSLEEVIARDYIVNEKPDVVINIVDGTNIERNLYLTTQLMELGVPVVVALNMMDMVKSRGDNIDISRLEKELGVPVIPTSANKGQGVREVVEKALQIAQSASAAEGIQVEGWFDEKIEFSINQVEKLIEDYSKKNHYSSRWLAIKLLEDDEKIKEKLNLPSDLLKKIREHIESLETAYENDVETIFADARYQYIGDLVNKIVKKSSSKNDLTLSDKIDKVLTNRVLAIPLFLLMMWGVFKITFGTVGTWTIDFVDQLIGEKLANVVSSALETAGASVLIHSLVVDGIIGGVGAVLVFVPQIMILFFFLSLLEDSGYMARAAFIMDRAFRKFGLTGKSFIPMLMGFGCSVPAVMATRTLENDKDRKMTIILSPFMSCGARLPIYLLFAGAFFANNQSTVIFSLYILGIIVAILSGIILKNTVFKGEVAPFVIELPPYRIPTLKGVLIHMWDRGKAFLIKAGTVIFAGAVIIWAAQTFSFSLEIVEDPADSILGVLGGFIAPIFKPLGFGYWQPSVAVFSGLLAKEAVVSTLGILHGLGEVTETSIKLQTALQSYFTPLSAYSFMTFTLLYFPCIAALGAIKREFNSWKWTWLTVGYQTGVAWIIAFLVYNIGRLFGLA